MNATSTVHRGAGRPTTEQAEARHEELLDAALDLFLEHGFELTTIEMTAARINMTKRTVYARYADKASLFRGAVQRAIERQVVPRRVLEEFDAGDLTETLASIARRRRFRLSQASARGTAVAMRSSKSARTRAIAAADLRLASVSMAGIGPPI